MTNYFLDNEDLKFQFDRLNLHQIVRIQEKNFTYSDKFEDAPANFEEAIDLYKSALELVGDIAANVVAPKAKEVDEQGAKHVDGKVTYAAATKDSFKKLAEAGLMGVIIPREYGGINFPATIYMMMIEMISRADASLMLLFGYQDVGETISRLGTEEQKKEFLLKYTSGEYIGGTALTEPGAGSDLQSIKLQATQDSDGNWKLRGVKQFISNGNGDVLIVLARSEPNMNNMFGLSLFVCHAGDKVEVTRIEDKMGLNGSPTCELYFNDAPAQLLGKRRQGLFNILHVLNHARFSVAAQALGIAESAYEEALNWAKERVQFGKKIYDMPPIADLLFNMRVQLESNRTLLYAGSQWLDQRNKLEEHIELLKEEGKSYSQEKKQFNHAAKMVDMLSPMIKYIVTETANKICYDAQQIHGGMGYMQEMAIERLYRDVRITSIYEGASQVQIIGASKGVFADILKEFFDKKEEKYVNGDLSGLVKYLQEIRSIFLSGLQIVLENDNQEFREAAKKDVVDIYSYIYIGYLLLDETENNERKKIITRRFIIDAYAKTQQSWFAIKNEKYNDLDKKELICERR